MEDKVFFAGVFRVCDQAYWALPVPQGVEYPDLEHLAR
jgi:hypothetical protein